MLSLNLHQKIRRPLPLLWEILGAIFVFLLIYNLLFWGRVFPKTYIAGLDLAGLTKAEAKTLLQESVSPPKALAFKDGDKTYSLNLSEVEFKYQFDSTADEAHLLYNSTNYFDSLKNRVESLFKPKSLNLKFTIDETALEEKLSVLADQVSESPIYPAVTLVNGVVVVEKGSPGTQVNREGLRLAINNALGSADFTTITLKKEVVDPSLSEEEVEVFENRAKNLAGKTLRLNFENDSFTYSGDSLLSLLDTKGSYNQEVVKEIIVEISAQVNRDPQNPVFVMEDGYVKEFAPSRDGAAVNEEVFANMIVGNLRTLETTEEKLVITNIPVTSTPSEIKTAEVNNLGIRELIGTGSSSYRGSIASRVHNIGVASNRFRGVLVKPGEIFSFNQVLGDVSAYTGYKQAYVIKDGQTVLGDGGGVCQVSTTLFRAVLDAGLPIVERRAHSYRVGYYEQDSPLGLDATIYSPTTDLKFKNDTPAHLLIQSYYNPSKARLEFEIYGTDDGRVATVSNPVTTSTSPPPEDLYIDDPTLPAGTIQQIDYKAWGAKVHFNYAVEKDGEVIYEKTFYSNYQPWQAKFLRGTGPTS